MEEAASASTGVGDSGGGDSVGVGDVAAGGGLETGRASIGGGEPSPDVGGVPSELPQRSERLG